jgi:hypothetical protein
VKRIIWSSVGLALGVLFIVGAVIGLNDDRVSCGGETMREGDVCVSKTRGGRTTENTLQDSQDNAKIGAIVGIAFGVLIIVIAAQNLRIGIKQRRSGGNMPQPAGHPQPGRPQQPGQNWHPPAGPQQQSVWQPPPTQSHPMQQSQPMQQPHPVPPQQAWPQQQPQQPQQPQPGWQQQSPPSWHEQQR